jgi:hypothetical protein
MIGFPDNEDSSYIFSPAEIPFFKDYYVYEVQCGLKMSVISASPKADMDKRQIYVMGGIRGIDTTDITDDGIVHLKEFDNIKYKWIVCGEDVCFIGLEGEDSPTGNTSIHEGYTCEVTKKSPIVGAMHFWKSVS